MMREPQSQHRTDGQYHRNQRDKSQHRSPNGRRRVTAIPIVKTTAKPAQSQFPGSTANVLKHDVLQRQRREHRKSGDQRM